MLQLKTSVMNDRRAPRCNWKQQKATWQWALSTQMIHTDNVCFLRMWYLSTKCVYHSDYPSTGARNTRYNCRLYQYVIFPRTRCDEWWWNVWMNENACQLSTTRNKSTLEALESYWVCINRKNVTGKRTREQEAKAWYRWTVKGKSESILRYATTYNSLNENPAGIILSPQAREQMCNSLHHMTIHSTQ